MFVDRAKIFVKAGKGGNGCVSFRREKFVPCGGPDGGDGGRGGNVVFKADRSRKTLAEYRLKQHFKAEKGGAGSGKKQKGKDGEDLVLLVPLGTIVKDEEGNVLADLVEPGQEVIVARGGNGGRGNARFVNSVNQAPRFAEKGEPGEEKWVFLELKVLADVGLVGFPNSGKSTLLNRLTRARSKVANYPFTTLHPHLGVLQKDDNSLVIADLPGLIEGAHEGRGLGDRFLRHIERCKVLLFLIDLAFPLSSPLDDYKLLEKELKLYDPKILEKEKVVAGNKIDLLEAQKRAKEFKNFFSEASIKTFLISGLTGKGISELVNYLFQAVSMAKEETVKSETVKIKLESFKIRKLGANKFEILGDKIAKMVEQVNWENPEGVDYFLKRLKKMGWYKELLKRGAREGDTVIIGGKEFIFKP